MPSTTIAHEPMRAIRHTDPDAGRAQRRDGISAPSVHEPKAMCPWGVPVAATTARQLTYAMTNTISRDSSADSHMPIGMTRGRVTGTALTPSAMSEIHTPRTTRREDKIMRRSAHRLLGLVTQPTSKPTDNAPNPLAAGQAVQASRLQLDGGNGRQKRPATQVPHTPRGAADETLVDRTVNQQ